MVAFATVLFLGSCQKEGMNSDLRPADPTGASAGLKAGKAKGAGVSANGQGTLMFNDRFQHFAFHASKDVNGGVSGSFELHSPGQDVKIHAEVLCLNVTGNQAIVTAQVTRVNEDNEFLLEVGTFITFKVKDNGEGANSPPDQFTDAYPLPYQRDCNLPFNIALQDILSGNIQVKK